MAHDQARLKRIVLLLVLAAGSAWWLYIESVVPFIATAASVGWTAERCRILSSVVTAERLPRRQATYRAAFSYTFPFRGIEYTGDRYDFGAGFASTDYGRMERLVAAHPGGSTAACSVHPSSAEAVLHRQPGRAVFRGAIPLYFLLLGGGGALLVAAFSLHWAPARNPLLRLAHRIDPPPAPLDGSPALVGDGARERDTVWLLGVNVGWNGFLAMCATQVLAGLGPPILGGGGVLLLSMVPLLGLGLRPLLRLAALFLNPRPLVTLEGRIAPGALTRVHWRLPGAGARRLLRMALTLEAFEPARTDGVGNRHEERLVSTHEIAHLRDPEAMTSGSAPLSLPPELQGPGPIHWRVRVFGEPRWWFEGPLQYATIFPEKVAHYLRWPEVATCFPLPVAPAEGDAPEPAAAGR